MPRYIVACSGVAAKEGSRMKRGGYGTHVRQYHRESVFVVVVSMCDIRIWIIYVYQVQPRFNRVQSIGPRCLHCGRF